MTWKDFWSLVPLVAAFGPGLFLFLRYQIKKKEPSQGALILVICWTYYLLLQSMVGRDELKRDHREVCAMLDSRMAKEDPDFEMVDECYRYTDDYASEVADAAANDAADR